MVYLVSDRAWIINLINCENFKWIVKIYTNFFMVLYYYVFFNFLKGNIHCRILSSQALEYIVVFLGFFLNSLVGFFNGFRMIFCFARIVWVNSISFRTSKTLAGGQIPLNISEDHTPSLFLYSWVQATIIPNGHYTILSLLVFYPENIYPRMKIIIF